MHGGPCLSSPRDTVHSQRLCTPHAHVPDILPCLEAGAPILGLVSIPDPRNSGQKSSDFGHPLSRSDWTNQTTQTIQTSSLVPNKTINHQSISNI